VFAALQAGTGDIFEIDLDTKKVTNLTKDSFGDAGPTWSPDGSYIIYVARISGYEKLFRLDIATGTKTQLTFGTHDDATPQFLDPNTLVFSSTATDPAQPLDPEVAKNGEIYNIWTLDMRSNQLRQYTDALGGNTSPIVLRDETSSPRIAFISYYKTDWELHALDRREPIATVASADFGAPGPVIDFQAPLSHVLVKDKVKKKGRTREALSRRAAAGEHRRVERRRRLRRVGGHGQRRPRRSAVQLHRLVVLAVPDDVVLLHQSGSPVELGGAGLLADAVLLRTSVQSALRPGVFGTHRFAIWPSRRARFVAALPMPSGRSTATGASSCSAAS
jgi:hypothetical protein